MKRGIGWAGGGPEYRRAIDPIINTGVTAGEIQEGNALQTDWRFSASPIGKAKIADGLDDLMESINAAKSEEDLRRLYEDNRNNSALVLARKKVIAKEREETEKLEAAIAREFPDSEQILVTGRPIDQNRASAILERETESLLRRLRLSRS